MEQIVKISGEDLRLLLRELADLDPHDVVSIGFDEGTVAVKVNEDMWCRPLGGDAL